MLSVRHLGSAVLVSLALTCHLYAAAGAESKLGRPCHEQPDLVGPCYSVRGRMNYSNGTPAVRIWVVGTKRILGVSDRGCEAEGCSLPAQVASKLSWHTDLFAEFVVCPFTHDNPGAMRFVCVDSATHLEVRSRDSKKK